MVRRAITLRSAQQAVKEMRPGVDNELEKLLQRKPPEFGIRLADDQSKVRDGYVAVEITGAKEAGADVALAKPFHIRDAMQAVERLLRLSVQAARR